MAIDCPEYGPEIVFKGWTRQVTSPDVTTAHAAPAGHSVMRSESRSRQPPFAYKRRFRSRAFNASWASVTRAWRALAMLWVQKGYRRSRDICVTVVGHSPLSRPVAWQRSSSPIGLGYRCYASTHPLNAMQMAVLRAAI